MVSNVDSGMVQDEVEQGEVFFDERRNEHYSVVTVGKTGVTLVHEDREYYIPHSIFATWYKSPKINQTDDRLSTSSR